MHSENPYTLNTTKGEDEEFVQEAPSIKVKIGRDKCSG